MLKEKIIKVLAQTLRLDINIIEKYGENENLTSLLIKSITTIQLIIKLEEEFDIEIAEEDLNLENFDTINKITTLLEGKYLLDSKKA
ncbi:phosphopantetheine-binding protein [Bacillus sp. SH8-8]|uniref:phosphopantetheine-binding protein n=1 Tax=Bacillus sp. SH8-8 TaxID=2217830 RepID=UPI0034D5C9BF